MASRSTSSSAPRPQPAARPRRLSKIEVISEWLTALIAAAAAIGGSGLTGAITWKATRRQLDAQRGAELAAALESHGHAVDRLDRELGQQLPDAAAAPLEDAVSDLLAVPHVEWLAGALHRLTLGRPLTAALDFYSAALNRLILIAPREVLAVCETLNSLVFAIDARDDEWAHAWQRARADLVVASRSAVGVAD